MNKTMIELDGKITKILPNTKFKILLSNDKEVIATIAGKLRMHFIKIYSGDKVKVAISPYDLTKGRIIYRYNKKINNYTNKNKK